MFTRSANRLDSFGLVVFNANQYRLGAGNVLQNFDPLFK